MNVSGRKLSGREKNEASIRLLEQLREKLYFVNLSTARRAAYNLSWMQEDGLEILREALLSNASGTTKNAAGYGLRKMRGRMKKVALMVLRQGVLYPNSITRDICKKALQMLRTPTQVRSISATEQKLGKFEIKDIPNKSDKRINVENSSLKAKNHLKNSGSENYE
jgi:hypothetical protein